MTIKAQEYPPECRLFREIVFKNIKKTIYIESLLVLITLLQSKSSNKRKTQVNIHKVLFNIYLYEYKDGKIRVQRSNDYRFYLILAGNLSHQLSTCSAVSLPSKIDDIGSDNEIGDADDQEYDVNDEDDDDDGFTAYDDEEYDSEGDGRTRSGDEVLNDEIENQQLQRHNYNNGRKSPNRKLGQR